MILLSWNCRGLGNPRRVRALHRLVRVKKPKMVFLMETKLMSKKMEAIRIKLGFEGMFVVDCLGRSGGLALMWKSDAQVTIQNFSRGHINAVIKDGDDAKIWKLTGFYGNPDTARRPVSWALLRHLARLSPVPWLCLGDFNEIISAAEKYSSTTRPPNQMRAFKEALEDGGLSDLGFSGPKFTWCNGRSGEEFTRERLDRALANQAWTAIYNVVKVNVLHRCSSDHHPLLVDFSHSQDVRWGKSKLFKYEASWAKQQGHQEVINKVWRVKQRHLSPWEDIQGKLRGCRRSLKQWVRKQGHSVEEQIQKLEEDLHKIQMQENLSSPGREGPLKEELNSLMEQEELRWKQRAKENWLTYGDRNSRFFHASANQKYCRSRISVIKDANGRQCNTKEGIETAFISYFQDLFTAGDNLMVTASIAALDRKVTEAMNQKMLEPFTVEEISAALNQMPPLKAPGPDGFSACFYQTNWATIHPEVCEAVLYFLNSGEMEDSINTTHIALIPKNLSPGSVLDYRPISLCNVIYKLISKVLANRLKVVLPDIISPTQSAFIPGRLITYNILVAYETMHSMQSRMWSKTGFMGIKLDMSKAYDRVEWNFLEAVMERLGFEVKWVNLVMKCIRTVTYAILVNGSPVGNIRPSRGIRQGDPISPYLFLLCAEALSALLSKAERTGAITGVPTSFKGPRLNHLFFADDSMLFCKANSVEWRRLFRILETYEAGSGQKLNINKTSIFFSRNTSPERKQEILRLSGLSEAHRIETYLGLPTFVGKSRNLAFKNIIAKVAQRLDNWKVKFLSQAGKEVLLKAVVQAIPTYSMGVFQLPISLCRELNQLMQNFWWNHMSQTSKIHWMCWEKMGRAKSIGGLGFRDLVIFNKAMLAKQGWRILQNPSSLAAQILKAKYYPKSNFLEAPLGTRPSFIWRSILSARELLKQGLEWRIGDGKSIKVWGDKWLPTPITYEVQSPIRILDKEDTVAELIDPETKWWNISLIKSIFSEEEAKVITNIPLSPALSSDRLLWRGTKNGEFTVRSAYHLGREIQDQAGGQCSNTAKGEEVWKTIWGLEVPNTVKMFLWKACHDVLPTKENLYHKRIVKDNYCPCCTLEAESIFHAVWSCGAARDVWGTTKSCFQKCSCEGPTFRDLFVYCMGRLSRDELEQMAVIARKIWLRRNALIFDGKFAHPDVVFDEAKVSLLEFKRCNTKERCSQRAENSVSSAKATSWFPPPRGTIKINWDASLNIKRGWIGLGVIARDNNGFFLGARSVTKQVSADPNLAEAMAALLALQFSKEAGFFDVIFEGDATKVINEINSEPPYPSRIGHFIENIHLEKGCFRSVVFSFSPRECNNAAHTLAKEASSNCVDNRWLEDMPVCIRSIVLRECSCP